jgi:oxygen-independent coproporphyrinogen-3 oxidase
LKLPGKIRDYFNEIPDVIQLKEMENDGLLVINDYGLPLQKGKPYVRNICMAFDLRLKRKAPETALFSMTI